MKNKTKDELLEIIEELEGKVSRLENDVDYWVEEYNEIDAERDDLKSKIDDLEYTFDNSIKNLDNFIWCLKLENLYNRELEDFIEDYKKYKNVE